MERVYLSRRNLLALLSKLDRQRSGQATACTIIKNDSTHPDFPQTMDHIEVVAVEDDAYYAHRDPGELHPLDVALSPMSAWPFPPTKKP